MKIKTVFFIYLINFLLISSQLLAQSPADITRKNFEKDVIRSSNIRSRAIIEYRFDKGDAAALADSGYKSYYFSYDNIGRITEYVKYHVFSNLTVREIYQYSGDNIIQTSRYNSAGEMIQTIDYRYNPKGKLKKEIHTAYYNSIRPGVHFTILASIGENELFSKLQDELEIEPKIESYTITVNISDPDELNQYVVIGDEMDPTSPRYSWSHLSISTQSKLLGYSGPNRKEHNYISKNIALVKYKYDRKGNLIQKAVYNTAGDMIERETSRYDGDNHKLAFYKYNENGKISSMETYVHDAAGRLIESAGLDPAGKIISKFDYKYDDAGNLNEKLWYNRVGELNGQYTYVHDSENRVTEETRFRDENEKTGRLTYKYDEYGNILEIIKYDIDDRKEKLVKYVYEFY